MNYFDYIRKYIVVFGLLPIFVLYQNCSSGLESGSQSDTGLPNSSIQAGTESNGNGAGYTGKLQLSAPASISEGMSYVVTIQGGTSPYQITSPQGNIEILSVSGDQYELRNNFGSSVTSFDIFVYDATGASVMASIQVVDTDNVFNYSFATSAFTTDDSYLVYDYNMRKVIVFDHAGIPKAMLNPAGDLRNSFLGRTIEIEQDSARNFHVLDPGTSEIHIYSSNYKFIRKMDLKLNAAIGQAVSFKIHNDIIYIVDGSKNLIHQMDLNGADLGLLNLRLNGQTLGAIHSVGFDERRNLIFLSDSQLARIHVFQNQSWLDSIQSFPLNSGGAHTLLGPKSIEIGPNGRIFIIDSIFKKGPYAGVNSGNKMGEEWTFALTYSQGQTLSGSKIFMRYLSYYNTATKCLHVSTDKLSFCNHRRELVTADLGNLSNQRYHHPRLGGYGTGVSEPRLIAHDEEGNYFVASDHQYIVGIDSKQNILYRKGGWGTADDQFKGITGLDVVGDLLFVAAEGLGKVKVHDKRTFELKFEFRLQDESGRGVAPRRLTASRDKLFISTRTNGIFITDLRGQKLKQITSFPQSNVNYSEVPSVVDFESTPDGILYFKDYNKRVAKYDSNQDLLVSVLRQPENWTAGLAVSDDGTVYINENNKIVVYDGDTWQKLRSFGQSGVMPGTFNGVSGISASENFVYVSDLYNQRVQKISIQFFKGP